MDVVAQAMETAANRVPTKRDQPCVLGLRIGELLIPHVRGRLTHRPRSRRTRAHLESEQCLGNFGFEETALGNPKPGSFVKLWVTNG